MRRFPDDYPRVLRLKDLAEIFGKKLKTIYALHSTGAFTHLEIRPRVGHPCFDRDRVDAHIQGKQHGLTFRRTA